MPKGRAGSTRVPARSMSIILAVVLAMAAMLYSFPQALASFSPEAAEQVIGVGRIQSSVISAPSRTETATHFETPAQLAVEPTEAVNQLAQPLDRDLKNTEEALADISDIKRFGEPDEDGWFTAKASAYGPSSAGQYTSLGTELTLSSADIGIRMDYMDLLGRHIEVMYGGVIVRTQIVDTGTLAPDRLFDLQPGLCTAFGAETPEFGWGVRTVKWRFAN